MVTCLIGTAACGKADQVQESQLQIDEASLINYSDQVVNALNEIVTGGMQDQYASDAVISAGISSWESAMSDLGAYNGVRIINTVPIPIRVLRAAFNISSPMERSTFTVMEDRLPWSLIIKVTTAL